MNVKNSLISLFNKIGFVLLLVLYISFSAIIVSILNRFNIDVLNMKSVPKTIILILIELLFVTILCFTYRKELKKEIIDYKNNFSYYFKFGLRFWIIGLIIMLVSNIILTYVLNASPNNEEGIQKMLAKLPVYIAFSSIVFAPFSEEMIFRKSLDKCFSNKILFIICSGLIFGGVHVITSKSLIEALYIIPYGTFGVIFAYMYTKTKNIFTSLTIHTIHNTLLVIVSLLSLGGIIK